MFLKQLVTSIYMEVKWTFEVPLLPFVWCCWVISVASKCKFLPPTEFKTPHNLGKESSVLFHNYFSSCIKNQWNFLWWLHVCGDKCIHFCFWHPMWLSLTVILQIKLKSFFLIGVQIVNKHTWLFSLGFCVKQDTWCKMKPILTGRVWYKVKVCEPAVLAVSFDKSRWSPFIFVFLWWKLESNWWGSVLNQCVLDLSSGIGVTDVQLCIHFLRYFATSVIFSFHILLLCCLFFSSIVLDCEPSPGCVSTSGCPSSSTNIGFVSLWCGICFELSGSLGDMAQSDLFSSLEICIWCVCPQDVDNSIQVVRVVYLTMREKDLIVYPSVYTRILCFWVYTVYFLFTKVPGCQ